MGLKMFKIYEANEAMLEKSIKNNTYFYYILLFSWVGFLLYATVYRDAMLLLDSLILMLGAITFMLVRKIDSCRLELIRK